MISRGNARGSLVEKRQAMGVYASNYRDRLDLSYILYNPQKPLINTRTSKFIYTDVLPSGENCVVAIACYTGYKIVLNSQYKILASLLLTGNITKLREGPKKLNTKLTLIKLMDMANNHILVKI
jgi:hypothetical protein